MKPKNLILVYNYKKQAWISPAGNQLTERQTDAWPTFFSLRLGLYKIVNARDFSEQVVYAHC